MTRESRPGEKFLRVRLFSRGRIGMNLEYKGYCAEIEYDAEDGIFIGEILGIGDSLNFHGHSMDELRDTFSQCIDNYLDLCRKVQKDPECV